MQVSNYVEFPSARCGLLDAAASAFLLDVGQAEADVAGFRVFLRAVRHVRDAVRSGCNVQTAKLIAAQRPTGHFLAQTKEKRKFTANLRVGFHSVLDVEGTPAENGLVQRRGAGRSGVRGIPAGVPDPLDGALKVAVTLRVTSPVGKSMNSS